MKNNFLVTLAMIYCVGCASNPTVQVAENKDPKFQPLRGMRYVIYVANAKGEHSEAAIEIENRIKSKLTDRGLVVVDFDSTSLPNILKGDGSPDHTQTKRVASNADIIITGRISEEEMKDPNINKTDNFRGRIRSNFVITETNTSIEKGRISDVTEEIGQNHQSALTHAAIKCGDEMGNKLTEKLLYVYEK